MEAGAVQIYVDGACRNNGYSNPQGGCGVYYPQGGCGVYWGQFHPMNTSETLIGEKQTNNCAELSSAIIALTQCKVLKFENVEINTDSKYVRDGITKWIQAWKANDWKLKGNTPVLNRDLWELLDFLQNDMSVTWKWVEAHANSTGNVEADELAKRGISVNGHYWQYKAKSFFSSSDATTLKQVHACDEWKNRVVNRKTEDYCEECTKEVSVSANGIQCGNCKKWYHYVCTKLPPYQLFMFEGSNRKYTCINCACVTEEFLKNNSFFPSSISITDKCSIGIQTSVIGNEIELQTSDITKANIDESRELAFTSMMNKTVSELESRFVEALDKLTSVQTENCKNVSEINSLKQENENLRKKLNAATSNIQVSLQKAPCNCNNVKRELENITIDKDNWRRRHATLSLQKEVEIAQCDANLKIIKQQLECAQGQICIMSSELENTEARISTKNVEILEMDKTIQEQRKHLNNLKDEVLSWKIHASRSDDSLLLEKDGLR